MIDWNRIAELRDEVGAEDFEEVLDLFMSEVEDCLAQLDGTASAQKLEEDMHFLKGSALNLGFRAFAELCQNGETASAQGNTDAVDVAHVQTLFTASKSEFYKDVTAKVA